MLNGQKGFTLIELAIVLVVYTHDSIHFVKHHSSGLTKFPFACSVSFPQRGAAVGSEA